MKSKIAVALSRQLGSGGGQIGQWIATRLGYRYMDREILRQAAEALGENEAELAKLEERVSPMWERILLSFSPATPESSYVPPPSGLPFDEKLFAVESRIIRSIVDQEDCVIVGRGASYVLRDHPGVIRLLIHAPLEFRIRRVMEIYHAPTVADARAMIERSDQERERFRKRMTESDPMRASNYHLCLDTSALPLHEAADLVAEFVRQSAMSGRSG